MARPKKHQKSKANNKPAPKQSQNRKRGGKQNDLSELRLQLDVLGLKIIQVTSDGNCFFRALADQLDGSEDEHEKYRDMVVRYIKDNQADYEPFIEDEVPFDDYCRSMAEDGTWAGHMELQVASLVTQSNICIHVYMSPRLIISCDKPAARWIHLSYHDGQHYNSVRLKEDTCLGPARPFIIKDDGKVSAKSNETKAADRNVHEESIKLVKAGSGCEDPIKIEQTLRRVGGNVDAAVEVLISEQGSVEQTIDDEPLDSAKDSNGTISGNGQHKNSELDNVNVGNNISDQDLAIDDKERTRDKSQLDDKKFSRNKACPCGSKKKYKSCCGTVAGRSSSRLPVNRTVDCGKSRKERKQGRKGGSPGVNSVQPDGGPLDMGALCI